MPYRMHRNSEPFGPAFDEEQGARDWFWSPEGKAVFLGLPGIHDRPVCAEAQSVFSVRRVEG